MKKINFKSEGLDLVGNLYYPADFQENRSHPCHYCIGKLDHSKGANGRLICPTLSQKRFYHPGL